MTALIDTNIIIRHLTGDPADQATAATQWLAAVDRVALVDLVVAETVYVLESYYRAPRPKVAASLRSLLAFEPVEVDDGAVLLRALELYEVERLDFAEAYLVARAERDGADVVSFDRAIDRVPTVRRVEPGSRQ